jgi:hypothetical protein
MAARTHTEEHIPVINYPDNLMTITCYLRRDLAS